MAANCLIIGQYGMWLLASGPRMANTGTGILAAKVDNLIVIEEQTGDKVKEAIVQFKQSAGQKMRRKVQQCLQNLVEIKFLEEVWRLWKKSHGHGTRCNMEKLE